MKVKQVRQAVIRDGPHRPSEAGTERREWEREKGDDKSSNTFREGRQDVMGRRTKWEGQAGCDVAQDWVGGGGRED
ncbi:hypothetical protein E2C01_084092 [Portunus trituberculatus]|uniref:Uncharacterized protein n=1 Tax=Portunus trituberculatus TaxID=210409 RepID=A0A5B7J896_PORTR|nr:hypothetical protein [Portunus trituberculatus]